MFGMASHEMQELRALLLKENVIVVLEQKRFRSACDSEKNQRTNGPVNAHLISWPTVSTKKNKILTSIKGRNSVANLRNTIIYNTNIDLVNDDVYTKFGLIL